jgi:7,8-dihydropterin-6-yl-methyl-4-(beta-D-ribofuranosyl)aminobenzene 5'-phosphate synthase
MTALTAMAALGVVRCVGKTPPALTPGDAPAPIEESRVAANKMTFTVVYDNNYYDPDLTTDWGFACLIQRGETVVLFDTGGDGAILTSNMSRLGLDSVQIDHIVLSHAHGDHTGGLRSVLAEGSSPVVWIPASFPGTFKDRLRSSVEVREIAEPTRVADGVFSTGELGSAIVEQSLVLESDPGLVVITGCAHPGIVETATTVKEQHSAELYLLMGGFHLGGKSQAELQHIAYQLKELGVKKLAPCHCTGREAMRFLANEWGDDFLSCGVGRVIQLPV